MSYKLRGFDIGFGQCDQKVTQFLDKVAKKGQNIYTKAGFERAKTSIYKTRF